MENEVKNVGKKTIIYGIIGILLCVIVILGYSGICSNGAEHPVIKEE